MNPYTYKRKVSRHSQTAVALSAVLSGAKSVFGANLGAIGLAMTLLAAGSAASLALYSQSELAAAGYVEIPEHVAMVRTSAVLGETVTASPVAPLPAFSYEQVKIFSGRYLELTATPLSYSQEKKAWNYRIAWVRGQGLSGSLSLNGKVVAQNIVGAGSYETGFTLKPEAEYKVIFYSDASNKGGKGVRVANRTLRVMEAEEGAAQPPKPVSVSMLKVTSPNGGEQWAAGTSQKITWSLNASSSDVNVFIRLVPQATRCAQESSGNKQPKENENLMPRCSPQKTYTLGSVKASSGEYSWKAGTAREGQVPAGSYKVEVWPVVACADAVGAVCPTGDMSDNYFTLTGTPAPSPTPTPTTAQ